MKLFNPFKANKRNAVIDTVSDVQEISFDEMVRATSALKSVSTPLGPLDSARGPKDGGQALTVTGKRAFEAAAYNRATDSWVGAGISFNREIRYALYRLRAISRDLAQNDPYIKKWLNSISNYTVGPKSFTIKNKAFDWVQQPDKSTKKVYDVYANSVIEENFNTFCTKEFCTVSENQSFRQFLNTILRSKNVDGEVFIKYCYPSTKDNVYGYSLQAFEASMVPEHLNLILPNGNLVVMGIEYNAFKKAVAYYFRKRPDNADFDLQYYANDYVRVDARDVIHFYSVEFVGQLRGYPQLVAIANRIKILKGYEDAALVNARSSAMKNLVLEYNSENFGEMGKADIQGADEDENGDIIQNMEPGTTYIVPKGMKAVDYNPKYPEAEHAAFAENVLYSVSAGLNIDNATLTSNVSRANYTSIRAAMLDSRLTYKTMQADIREIIIEPIYKKVIELSILTGRLNLPFTKIQKFNKPLVMGFTPDWVDPLKDGRAENEAIEAKRKTMEESLADRGIDLQDHLDQLQYEQEEFKRRGIVLNTQALVKQEIPADEAPATQSADGAKK